jgi:hypothetical protein
MHRGHALSLHKLMLVLEKNSELFAAIWGTSWFMAVKDPKEVGGMRVDKPNARFSLAPQVGLALI